MPSFQDSAIIVILALLLFGPKGMAKLARELGKLMGEFRRASADFRYQMEEEFRVSEQADQQKKIAAMEAAAPVAPVYPADVAHPEHPHLPNIDDPLEASPEIAATAIAATTSVASTSADPIPAHSIDRRQDEPPSPSTARPLPIASAGDLHLMPPATGLPLPRSGRAASLGSAFDSIPHKPDPETANHTSLAPTPTVPEESQTHG